MKKLLYIIAFVNVGILQAQDRFFTYTYQSNVLNKGQKEIEVWNTFRTGRENYYSRLDNRTEFEIGLGGKLQTAFYLNLTSITTTIDYVTEKSLETENETSFSNEWKLKLLDPVANSIGLALYAEYSIGSNEYELESKIILDKRVNKFTIASNIIYEIEFEPETEINELEWKKEQKANVNLSFAYSLNSKFVLTQENTFRNVFIENEIEHSALYSGLGFSYSQESYWINFTVLPQLVSFMGQTDNKLNLNEFEKVQLRLLFSYAF